MGFRPNLSWVGEGRHSGGNFVVFCLWGNKYLNLKDDFFCAPTGNVNQLMVFIWPNIAYFSHPFSNMILQ